MQCLGTHGPGVPSPSAPMKDSQVSNQIKGVKAPHLEPDVPRLDHVSILEVGHIDFIKQVTVKSYVYI